MVFRLRGRVVTGHSQHLDDRQYLERDMSREYDSDSMESSPVWVRGPAVTSDGKALEKDSIYCSNTYWGKPYTILFQYLLCWPSHPSLNPRETTSPHPKPYKND